MNNFINPPIFSKSYQKSNFPPPNLLDDTHSKWEKAIANDGLPWINVSDLLGFNNIMAQMFMLDHVPFNILLDNNFSIVSTNIGPSYITELINKSISK